MEEVEPFGMGEINRPQNQLTELGYLVDGRKEGLWISWDENQIKISEIYWMKTGWMVLLPFGTLMERLKHRATKDGEVMGNGRVLYLRNSQIDP